MRARRLWYNILSRTENVHRMGGAGDEYWSEGASINKISESTESRQCLEVLKQESEWQLLVRVLAASV